MHKHAFAALSLASVLLGGPAAPASAGPLAPARASDLVTLVNKNVPVLTTNAPQGSAGEAVNPARACA